MPKGTATYLLPFFDLVTLCFLFSDVKKIGKFRNMDYFEVLSIFTTSFRPILTSLYVVVTNICIGNELSLYQYLTEGDNNG